MFLKFFQTPRCDKMDIKISFQNIFGDTFDGKVLILYLQMYQFLCIQSISPPFINFQSIFNIFNLIHLHILFLIFQRNFQCLLIIFDEEKINFILSHNKLINLHRL